MLVPGSLWPLCVALACLLSLYAFLGFAFRRKWSSDSERKEEIARLLAAEAAAETDAVARQDEAAVQYGGLELADRIGMHECAVCFHPATNRCSRCKAIRYCSSKCQFIHWRQGHNVNCHPPSDIIQVSKEARGMGGDQVVTRNPKERNSVIERKLHFSCEAPIMDDMEVKSQADAHTTPSDFSSSGYSSWKGFATSSTSSESVADVSKGPESLYSDEMGKSRSQFSRTKTHKEENGFVKDSSPIPGEHLVPGAKSVKVDDDSLLTMPSEVVNLPKSTYIGIKKSTRKVVQHFKVLKSSTSQFEKYNCKVPHPYKLFEELYSWDKVELYPFGLINCGNSCYANSVLQCLAFTRPLTSYLLQELHSKECQQRKWCFLCEFECLIIKASEGFSPLSPVRILSQIQKIGSHLGHGREEDAHEFLRCVVDTMQSICLTKVGVSPLAEETTLVGLTFGGYLQSKIKCIKCCIKSKICERMMDLTVEIDGDIGILEEALAQYTATEILDGENKYYCGRCKSYERAKKKLMVLEAPNVLTIVLKRFQSGYYGKLNKFIRFPEILNMAPYMSGNSDNSPLYCLYAVVVHLDVMNAAFSGHYVCYIKTFTGKWFRIDDSRVEPVALETVLSQGAYMLLYARFTPRASALRKTAASHDGKSIRTLEAISRRQTGNTVASNTNSNSPISRQDHFMQSKKGKSLPAPATKGLLDSDYSGFHRMPRYPITNSSSESSLFSCSDESSCSTASTMDSSSTEDFVDYILGEVGTGWYNLHGV